ncbi:uncharacterized protein JN550_002463 [Neoarthrinium moseri]|uniref:uncharacterized protein n=1 Tax=Neoarthrinium moseri TaxID=1658444 RepID=UPI001FDCB192|nr:uncharacterized protein JN550_002463 [Neoarthrinium moseri]KAI1875034.1 hypothetical protein JN550_002463 [Neoarthrinium moseri]
MESTQIVSIVALIVSSTALIWSTLQLIHSYLSSAKGYSKINEKVMPKWDVYKSRVFLWDQFRFQVNFYTPVLVVCPPKNKEFPIRDADGKSEGSQGYSFIGGSKNTDLIPSVDDRGPAIHTVNNERATWITLLSVIHEMETTSSRWETEQFSRSPPSSCTLPKFDDHTLAVAIQRKQRSWDDMPSSITKPYATTTICHIIEIAAMLGIHWKEFDRSKDIFLAEGNGLVFKATSVTELGTVFTFQVSGKSEFKDGRIIPVDSVKELAFGFVSTLYRKTKDLRRVVLPTEEAKDLATLQLGTTNEFAETLVSFGCNTETSKCIRDNDKRHGHLYPLAFEILGMLGKIFHVKKGFFRVLPNPTFYHWNRQYFSLPSLLLAYKRNIGGECSSNKHLNRLQTRVENVERVIHQTQPSFSAALLDALHEALELCDKFLTQKVPREKVGLVLRTHIQVVLSMLNETERGPTLDRSWVLRSSTETAGNMPAFASLDGKPPESKQDELINIYFTKVLPKINGVDPGLPPLTSGPEVETNIWLPVYVI